MHKVYRTADKLPSIHRSQASTRSMGKYFNYHYAALIYSLLHLINSSNIQVLQTCFQSKAKMVFLNIDAFMMPLLPAATYPEINSYCSRGAFSSCSFLLLCNQWMMLQTLCSNYTQAPKWEKAFSYDSWGVQHSRISSQWAEYSRFCSHPFNNLKRCLVRICVSKVPPEKA